MLPKTTPENTTTNKISVIVPTANRPGMLRCALESIAKQNAVRSIRQVLVIENLGNSESGNVAQKFSSLPIEYILRDPPLPVGFESLNDAHRRTTGEYTAILFDDDWWMPDHLENAIKAVQNETNVVASYSSYVTIANEQAYLNTVCNTFLNWFAAKSGPSDDRWIFELEELLIANLIATTGSFMTLLVKRSIFEKCLPCISHGNPYDTDRLLAVEFGRHGKVVFTRRPTVYVRIHPGQETHRLENSEEALHWWRDSTERLLSLANSAKIDLAEAFASRMQTHSVEVTALRNYACHDSIEHLSKLGILPTNLPQMIPSDNSRLWHTAFSRAYRSLTPPLFQVAIDQLRSLADIKTLPNAGTKK
jgi:hypothetical protein